MHAFGEFIPLIYFLLLKRYQNKKKKLAKGPYRRLSNVHVLMWYQMKLYYK